MAEILLIEDDDAVRATLQEMLKHLGHAVTALPNGRRVVEGQLQEAPDVVLTDVFMPDVDGLETISAVRQRYPDARIVAMTGGRIGMSIELVATWVRSFGANALLRKPFNRQELVSALKI